MKTRGKVGAYFTANPNEIFIRSIKKSEKGKSTYPILSKIPSKRGYKKVYMPYGGQGAGFYYVKDSENPLTSTEKKQIRDWANVQYAISKRYSSSDDSSKSAFYFGRSVGMGKVAQSYNPTLMIPIKSGEQLEHLFKAQGQLAKAGVTFDTGTSIKNRKPISRHWELDWSLKGASMRNPDVKGLKAGSLIKLTPGSNIYQAGSSWLTSSRKSEKDTIYRVMRKPSSKGTLRIASVTMFGSRQSLGADFIADLEQVSEVIKYNPSSLKISGHWLKSFAKKNNGTYKREVLSNGMIVHTATVPDKAVKALKNNPFLETLGGAALTGVGVGLGLRGLDIMFGPRKKNPRGRPLGTIWDGKRQEWVRPNAAQYRKLKITEQKRIDRELDQLAKERKK